MSRHRRTAREPSQSSLTGRPGRRAALDRLMKCAYVSSFFLFANSANPALLSPLAHAARMGCDGGSIPTRRELVRTSKKAVMVSVACAWERMKTEKSNNSDNKLLRAVVFLTCRGLHAVRRRKCAFDLTILLLGRPAGYPKCHLEVLLNLWRGAVGPRCILRAWQVICHIILIIKASPRV